MRITQDMDLPRNEAAMKDLMARYMTKEEIIDRYAWKVNGLLTTINYLCVWCVILSLLFVVAAFIV